MDLDDSNSSSRYLPFGDPAGLPDSVILAARVVVAQDEYPHARIASIVDGHLPLKDVRLERRALMLRSGLSVAPPEDSEAVGVPIGSVVPNGTAGSAGLVALIAPSGYGKSTAVQTMAAQEAEALLTHGVGRMPVWMDASAIITNDIDPDSPSLLGELLQASRSVGACAGDLQARITGGGRDLGVVFLIDAIDQLDFDSMGDALERLTRVLVNLQSVLPSSPILITSREDVWYSERCRSLRRRATTFQLQSLNLTDIALYMSYYVGTSPTLTREVVQEIEVRVSAEPKLSSLMRRPLMLALAMHVVERTGRLPGGLGGICFELAQMCLSDQSNHGELSQSVIESILEEVAWHIEKAARRSPLESANAAEVGECVRRVVGGRDRRSVQEASAIETSFLGGAHYGFGLFGEIAPDEYGFADDVFRLYYMGRYLFRLDRTTLYEEVSESSCAGALVLRAQALAYGGEVDSSLMLVEDLCESPRTSDILLSGDLLASVIEIVRSARPQWLARRAATIRNRLSRIRSGNAELVERDRAGRSLAMIGDPILRNLPEKSPTVTVPEGTWTFGSDESPDVIGDKPKYERIHWFPPYRSNLCGYEISVHPVTNLEYGMFLSADGYDRSEFWQSAESRRWRSQDREMVEWLRPVVLESLGLHYRKDIEAGFMSVVDFEKMRDEFVERLLVRKFPLYWNDPRFNRSNQPVVGVNQWEAKAYCVWLTDYLREVGRIDESVVCRLPTEEEWERAAGAPGDRYPWGSEWREDYCHMRGEPWVAAAVSIGSFAAVPSHLGCQDMIGNVFDATLSAAEEYSSRPSDHAMTGMREIITRGGSWLATTHAARSVRFRSWDPPCNAYADQSFRWVISPLDLL